MIGRRDAFVGVENENPPAPGSRESDVARRAEIVRPRRRDDAGPEASRLGRGEVGRACIDNDHLIGQILDTGKRLADMSLLVPRDHANGYRTSISIDNFRYINEFGVRIESHRPPSR